MKITIKILCCFFVFIANNYAQNGNTTSSKPIGLGIKMSVLALAEHATCLDISPEIRIGNRFAIQPEIGYYNDILRNTNYNKNTSAMSGIRFGGELRYYFKNWDNDKTNWYTGLSYVNNLSKVAILQDALILRSGSADVIKTPIRFNHERMFIDAVFGFQSIVKKRVIVEVFTGFGVTNRSVTNLEQDQKDIRFADCAPQVELWFPRSNLWSGPTVFDTRGFINFALGVKIGYRLY